MNYVYILRCNDGTLYTGWTNNIYRRLKAHRNKTGAKYTRSRLPIKLVHIEVLESSREAQKRESFIKKNLTKSEKEKLVSQSIISEEDNQIVVIKNGKEIIL